MTSVTHHKHQEICTTLLLDACTVYSEIKALYEKLESNISANPNNLSTIISRIHRLQNQVSIIDRDIGKTLIGLNPISDKNQILLQKREELLKDNLARNLSVSHKASAIKSHLQHEFGLLKTNRLAISGYRTPGVKRKNLINRSF